MRPPQPIPDDCRSNFRHLYGDVIWYGLLNGSILAFISIYAARLGASIHYLGLLTAAPAIVNLIFALPAGRWLGQHSAGTPVFWSAVFSRAFYLFLIPLPWIFKSSEQITIILLITYIMNIPGTALAIGFNALFGDVVPIEYRGYVAGLRNSLLGLSTIITTLICGELLIRVPFPLGYQIVFFLGFLGSTVSTYHIWFLKQISTGPHPESDAVMPDMAPREATLISDGPAVQINRQDRWNIHRVVTGAGLRFDLLTGRFGRLIGLLFSFHLAQYLAIPLFSIYMVDNLHFSDQTISFGTAMFNISLFVASTQFAGISSRIGNQKTIGAGVVLISTYPFLMGLARGPELYILANLFSGTAWAMIAGAIFNYLLEMAPENDRPAHMAWYNLALNAAILIGSLAGPLVAGWTSIIAAMFIFALMRFLSGIAILKWG